MPHAYEVMRDRFKDEGMSDQAAKAKAARIYNSEHPDTPVTRASAVREAQRRLQEKTP